MQYHAHALAVNGVDVDLVGESGVPLPGFLAHNRICIHRLPERRPAAASRVPYSLRAAALSLTSAVELVACLRRLPRPNVIVVQTPPAIPSLVVAWLAGRWHRARVVFDWHNFGWTILALRFTTQHRAVRVARAIERWSARLGDAHLAVSQMMAAELVRTWSVSPVAVFHDRPADIFAPSTADTTLRARLVDEAGFGDGVTPAFAIAPTGWTRDEDMSLLLQAADHLERAWIDGPSARRLVIAITGQGAGRRAFEARLAARRGERVQIVAAWAEPDEYPRLVAAADAGICVHRSSSGVDLPMKVCDMLGAGVPACVLDYGAVVRETVQPDGNALLFRDAAELAACLDRLFTSWPEPTPVWTELRAGALAAAAGEHWTAAWAREALPVLFPL
jgi:beta-1,4-mannosyltransferase